MRDDSAVKEDEGDDNHEEEAVDWNKVQGVPVILGPSERWYTLV